MLITLGFSACLLVAVELSVQTWVRYFRTDYETYDRSAGTPALVPGVYESEDGDSLEINESGFVGPPISSRKEGVWRIVSLGDSCTMGFGRKHYPAILQRYLETSSPEGRHYEVVNAAISGLDSEQALRRLVSQVPSLEPDVVTIYLGWNDMMKFAPRSQTRYASLSGLSRSIDRLGIVRGLRKLVFFHWRPLLGSPLTGPSSQRDRFDRFHPTYFEENLRAIVRATRGFGARAMLLTLPSAVHLNMDVEDLRRRHIQFPYFASGYAVGDFIDLIESYNRAIRRVGVEEGVLIVDLAEAFATTPHARELFWDSMHPSLQGRDFIARILANALVHEDLARPPPASSDFDAEAARQLLALEGAPAPR